MTGATGVTGVTARRPAGVFFFFCNIIHGEIIIPTLLPCYENVRHDTSTGTSHEKILQTWKIKIIRETTAPYFCLDISLKSRNSNFHFRDKVIV